MDRLKVALDYDGVLSDRPDYWGVLIVASVASQVDIRVVTSRPDSPSTRIDVPVPTIYTCGAPKKRYCREVENWEPDVWIDDNPESI